MSGGGTVRYHRAEFDPGEDTWRVWFRPTGGYYSFSGAEGEAMGLTPPPAPLVVTCNGHRVELPEWELDDFIAEWGEDGIEDYSAGSSRLATRFAYWLRDARQDPQPASDTHGSHVEPMDDPYKRQPEQDDTASCIDFDALPIGTVLKTYNGYYVTKGGNGNWFSSEEALAEPDHLLAPYTVVYQPAPLSPGECHRPAPVSPSEGLRAVLAGRDDADELIEYAATSYRSDRVLGPGRHLLGAVGDAARSGGAT